MKSSDLEVALRAFARRRPFQPFWLELLSGDRVKISHPEVIERTGNLFPFRSPKRSNRIFSAESICQLLDDPVENP